MEQPPGKTVQQFIRKFIIGLLYDPTMTSGYILRTERWISEIIVNSCSEQHQYSHQKKGGSNPSVQQSTNKQNTGDT